jgi:hypothetical protein
LRLRPVHDRRPDALIGRLKREAAAFPRVRVKSI